jgi:hypothetical protein
MQPHCELRPLVDVPTATNATPVTPPCLLVMRRILVLLLLCGPTLAKADPAPDARTMHDDDCAKMLKQNRKCKILDMGKGEDVTGNRVSNDEIRIDVIESGKHGSLIRIRRDFIVEILKTAEDL